jgi:hypothetical protein
MTAIEAEGRHARPDEQEKLARFTAFGASDLADRIFRRAGDAFAPAWEDLGVELEALVSRDDLAHLKRATQYAHFTPEFMIRAIWRALRRMGFDGGRVLEPGCGTGLNTLIDKVFAIWEQTANNRYTRADGVPYALPGAAQMIFSDLGTLAAEETRGFSAYRWIKESLVARGVPASQIAFMQDHKKSSAKQRLFNAVNGGQVRILIGSSETMGTGVNAQRRLKALHHLDVPWLPSQIEQREGRIERQGNENAEIELYAYATKRSVDATGWQILERKARFIDAAMSGDRSVRRIEDAGSQANQFALAKAIASGDERLMRKAGIASEIARLERLRDSHFDDQFAIRRRIGSGEKQLEDATRRSAAITQDLARRIPTRGNAFTMTIGEHRFTERKAAGVAHRLRPQDEASKAGLNRANRHDRRLHDGREDHLLRRYRTQARPRAQVIRRH